MEFELGDKVEYLKGDIGIVVGVPVIDFEHVILVKFIKPVFYGHKAEYLNYAKARSKFLIDSNLDRSKGNLYFCLPENLKLKTVIGRNK